MFTNSGELTGKYAGADAGFLVTALTSRPDIPYYSYSLNFRTKDRGATSSVWWGQADMLDVRKLDIDDNQEKGIVEVRRLPPGEYEFFNFRVEMNTSFREWWSSKKEFAIPFTIKPGEATYVGEFMAVGVKGKNLFGLTVPDGAYFVLSNKIARDTDIAKRKEPGIVDVISAVIDPGTLSNPLISAAVH